MSHTFRRNKNKGTYEVLKGTTIVKECRTMQEATSFIAEKDGISKPVTKLAIVPPAKKKEIGFGKDGIPSFMLKATGVKYEVNDAQKDK